MYKRYYKGKGVCGGRGRWDAGVGGREGEGRKAVGSRKRKRGDQRCKGEGTDVEGREGQGVVEGGIGGLVVRQKYILSRLSA